MERLMEWGKVQKRGKRRFNVDLPFLSSFFPKFPNLRFERKQV